MAAPEPVSSKISIRIHLSHQIRTEVPPVTALALRAVCEGRFISTGKLQEEQPRLERGHEHPRSQQTAAPARPASAMNGDLTALPDEVTSKITFVCFFFFPSYGSLIIISVFCLFTYGLVHQRSY